MTGSPSKVLVIVGPTASGKSAVAEALADLVETEIISADSMQVYRGFDVATDKPDRRRRERYRYHLLDVADPTDPFTVVRYRDLARDAIAAVHRAGRLPILVGGSGLYVRAVIDDLDFPPALGTQDDDTRSRLDKRSTDELYAQLAESDPEAARRIHPNNRRRIVRALEFASQTGRLFSELQQAWRRREALYDVRILGLRRARQALNESIDKRVDAMVAAGLVEEARRWAGAGREVGHTSRQALGHKELAGYLAGVESLEDALERLKRATRRYAKRQMTWFSADERVAWIDADDMTPSEVAGLLVASLIQEGWLSPDYVKVGT